MNLPSHGRMAVFDRPNAPFRLVDYPLRPPLPGEVLVRILMSTICRSDIHSYQGHRPSPCPGLLGHEIIGTIEAVGSPGHCDMKGSELAPGDRVTWSEYFTPGPDYFSEVLDLPQKSFGVEKYGHLSAEQAPHHHGGFAEFCYIMPNSWILRLPDALSDEEATPINCGVATMAAVIEAAEIKLGDSVVIQGLGLLGIYGAALARARGAGKLIGLDISAERRALALRFGVDVALDPATDGGVDAIKALCQPAGADVVLEVCGDPAVLPAALAMLRMGGRYVLAGVVNPASNVSLDANLILRKMLTLKGVHNYHPRHLVQAMEFVLGNHHRFPFHELVDGKYRLDEIDQAMADAAGRRVLRAAIVP